MDRMRRCEKLAWAIAVVVSDLFGPAVLAATPDGYPSDYSAMAAAARKEGTVVVYSTTDLSAVASLIRDFESANPGIKVDYNDLNSTELYNRFRDETASRRPSADVLWSSAMDLQMKLANDNFAARYRSPEAPSLPDWAIWRDEAFGTTFEPAVFVYSTRFVPASDVPHTHAEFLQLITSQPDKYAGNVITYDVEKSAVGFLFATQDSRMQPAFWDLVKAFGARAVELESSTSVMVQRIASGKDYLGYNLIGSYALTRARRDPSIGVVLPTDYTLVMSRIALISKTAAHPQGVETAPTRRGVICLTALPTPRPSASDETALRVACRGVENACSLRPEHIGQFGLGGHGGAGRGWSRRGVLVRAQFGLTPCSLAPC